MLKTVQSILWPNMHSRERWLCIDNFSPDWGERAALAATFITSGSTVIDIGCGRMQLNEHLPTDCHYTPADMQQWTPDVIPIDINAGLYPLGTYDYAVVLGVIEYLYAPDGLFRWTRSACRHLILSYVHPTPSSRFWHRRRYGWVNDFTAPELCRKLEASGWSARDTRTWRENTIYYCTPS